MRKLFGVLFQDGALFGSMNLYDNVAFPLREHTKKSESEIRDIVMEKMDLVGLVGAEDKLPGEISGGMRKRAGLARALVLDPEIILFDEPDSGLDPVRTAYLNQLIIDLNAQIDATFLIVTHDINTARTVPDNIGLLYHRHLAMFGPREMLLSSEEPVVRQFLNAQRVGPIGMSEEKDADELAGREGPGARRRCRRSRCQLRARPTASPRRSQRPPGEWCRENGVTPPPGSFEPSTSGLAPGGLTARWPHLTASPGARARSATAGKLFAFGLDVGRGLFRRPFQLREFIQQAWFIASVTILPTALVAIPFGAVIALQLGALIQQLGAQSFTGAAIGARRRPRGRPDRHRAAHRRRRRLGDRAPTSARARSARRSTRWRCSASTRSSAWSCPRVLACMLVAVLLNGLVSVVGVAGGYFFNVVLQGGTPGAYLASFTALAQLPDLWSGRSRRWSSA